MNGMKIDFLVIVDPKCTHSGPKSLIYGILTQNFNFLLIRMIKAILLLCGFKTNWSKKLEKNWFANFGPNEDKCDPNILKM